MASEQEREEMAKKVRSALLKTGLNLTLGQLHMVEDILLGEICPPPKPKPKRRCGASYPYEDADRGWSYCIAGAGHPQAHEDADGVKWRDGYVATVVIEDEIRSVPDHAHDFNGDEDTCTTSRNTGCPLTWGEFKAQDREWGMDHD